MVKTFISECLAVTECWILEKRRLTLIWTVRWCSLWIRAYVFDKLHRLCIPKSTVLYRTLFLSQSSSDLHELRKVFFSITTLMSYGHRIATCTKRVFVQRTDDHLTPNATKVLLLQLFIKSNLHTKLDFFFWKKEIFQTSTNSHVFTYI